MGAVRVPAMASNSSCDGVRGSAVASNSSCDGVPGSAVASNSSCKGVPESAVASNSKINGVREQKERACSIRLPPPQPQNRDPCNRSRYLSGMKVFILQ